MTEWFACVRCNGPLDDGLPEDHDVLIWNDNTQEAEPADRANLLDSVCSHCLREGR